MSEFADPRLPELELGTCVLAGGDVSDLRALRTWCAELPQESYGRIFLEVFSPIQIEPLDPPPGVGVTWICREQLRPTPRPGVGIPRGEALTIAVDAWLDEWLRADPNVAQRFVLWTGGSTSSIIRSFWRRVENEFAALWSAPHTPPTVT